MKYRRTVFIIGLIVLLMPFLGFPRLWKTIFFVVAGLLLMTLSLRLRRKDPYHIIEENKVAEMIAQRFQREQ